MELIKRIIDKIKYLDTWVIYLYIEIKYIDTSINIPKKNQTAPKMTHWP
jgi:hypothetical protein